MLSPGAANIGSRHSSRHEGYAVLLFSLVLAVVFATAATAAAQPAPFRHYKTLDTEHFSVNVPDGLEREGRVAGAAAERAYALLARELKPPRGPINLTVTDDADYSNGYAQVTPSNRIVVYAAPPIETNSLRLNEDWLQVVITHELTHIFHLDRASGIWNVAQHIFGREPSLFPNQYGPSWIKEGLAVYYESKLTKGGRLKDAEHSLIARSAAQAQKFPSLGDLSLGTAVFPGGERAYAYGSLFIDFIARAQGDSGIGAFIDAESRGWIPYRLNHYSERAFGRSFQDVFEQFRDSIIRSAGGEREPVSGWRQLTSHPFYASDARWLNDSTLVYAGNDGRSTSAEYELRVTGERRRLGRRSALGGSVPFPGGGLLFAQLEFETADIVRSDLYVENNGRQRRLTHGARLVEPDVRADGTIVCAQLAAARSNLVLLDSGGHIVRTLRAAGPDETWSEPRWSPDGTALVATHRTHGGVFTIEVIDVESNVARVLDRGRSLLGSPSWTPDGRAVVYTSEAGGIPMLARASRDGVAVDKPVRDDGGTGVFTPETSPDGKRVAVATLRYDGYHLGIAPTHAEGATPSASSTPVAPLMVAADTQPLAAGDYRSYSAWRSLLPTYWRPMLERGPGSTYRIGAATSGVDVLSRHSYDAYLAVPMSGALFATGRFRYQYAGFRRPYVNLELSKDYTGESSLTSGGTTQTVGELVRRTQNASLSATFLRPRVRSSSSFSLGTSVERRSFATDPAEFLKQLDTTLARSYTFPSAFVAGAWSNLQRPTLSISPEDGLSAAVTVRERLRADLPNTRSGSVVATTSAFKSLDLPGFAHHVLALRVAAGVADKRSASSFQVGGTSGSTIELVPGYIVGEGRRTFGVRGFAPASVYGTSAVAGSFEYRAPLLLPARGLGALPVFFDRSSISAFVDAGQARCVDSPYVPQVCAPASRLGRTIGSVGGELFLQGAVLDYDSFNSTRLGFAVPVVGRDVVAASRVSLYVAYGLSF